MSEVSRHNGVALEDRIRGIVEEVIQGTSLYVVEVNVRGRKGSQVVDVFIDSDGALDVEELARVSREVGFLLDAEEVMQGAYSLNVSSLGVNRPLTLPRQFKKNVHRKLKVKYRDAADDGPLVLVGELARADDEGIELKPDKGSPVRIGYDDILEAKVQLPW